MIYRFTDTRRPGEHLDLTLKRSEWYDLDSPEIDEDNVTELLDWWSDPKGRGYHELENGGYIVLVEASSGEPDIGIWSPGLQDIDSWELGDFPFGSLSYAPLPEEFDDIVEEQGWNVDSVSMIRGSYINNPEGAATLAEFARRIADEENGQ